MMEGAVVMIANCVLLLLNYQTLIVICIAIVFCFITS